MNLIWPSAVIAMMLAPVRAQTDGNNRQGAALIRGRWKICFAQPGHARPKAFRSKGHCPVIRVKRPESFHDQMERLIREWEEIWEGDKAPGSKIEAGLILSVRRWRDLAETRREYGQARAEAGRQELHKALL